jgi:uncharacterized protein YqeY
MSEKDMIEAVKKSIVNCEAKTSKDMGKVMVDVKKNHGDNADMSMVSKIVRELLSL